MSRRPARAALVTLLACAPLFGPLPSVQAAPQEASRVDTLIRARYQEAGRRLDGTVTQTWTNATSDTVPSLWFHLYHNAFSNNRTTHMREANGSLRGERMREGWGWQRVTSITVGGAELIGQMAYRQPDDGNADDKTVFSVDLPTPVGPGETVAVTIEWEAEVPRVRRRTGYKDDFLFMAHWFPKLAVYEQGRGWNCHQFHAYTEFYGNYGTYDVTLDLPAKYQKHVFASGKQEGPPILIEGDMVRTRFVAPTLADQARTDSTGKHPLVHAFTWTADPEFRVKKGLFHYEEWAKQHEDEVDFVKRALGREQLDLRTVDVTLLMQDEHLGQWKRHFDATCAALFFYGIWFGGYPYEQITVVDPAWGARAAGGMEYPTLFTSGTSMFNSRRQQSPEGVTVHEAGHQFWYGLVGNNEFEAAWLDEGFNSYADSEALFRHYGERYAVTRFSGFPYHGVAPVPAPGGGVVSNALAVNAIPLPLLPFELAPLRPSGLVDWWRDQPLLTYVEQTTDPRWSDRSGYLSSPDRDPIERWGWQYVDRNSYSQNSYRRPAVALRSLPAAMGENGRAKFLRGMRHYSEVWRYRHPYPDDFFEAFNQGSGVDMGWYFEDLFRGTGTVDWLVNVSQRREAKPRGFFQDSPGGEFVEVPVDPVEERLLDAEEAGEEDTGDADGRPWKIEILVERKGELRLPLPIRWTLADGSSETRVWTREEQAEKRWLKIDLSGDKKLASVVLDPERGYFLDLDMQNNAWFDEVDEVAPWRWAERAFSRYVHLLHWQAGIGG